MLYSAFSIALMASLMQKTSFKAMGVNARGGSNGQIHNLHGYTLAVGMNLIKYPPS